MGLFKSDEKVTAFSRQRKAYHLLQEGDLGDEDKYVYFGYAPASIAMVEHACKAAEDPRQVEELGKNLPDQEVTTLWRQPNTIAPEARVQYVFVFFLGGVTCSELSALRLLGKRIGKKFIVATTALINAQNMINLAREA